uniref:peptidylprolyl isomerase n=1 Tax=Pyramimonas obovata TaxID=1411642 RepID=A0A7S0RBS2_9CHLO
MAHTSRLDISLACGNAPKTVITSSANGSAKHGIPAGHLRSRVFGSLKSRIPVRLNKPAVSVGGRDRCLVLAQDVEHNRVGGGEKEGEQDIVFDARRGTSRRGCLGGAVLTSMGFIAQTGSASAEGLAESLVDMTKEALVNQALRSYSTDLGPGGTAPASVTAQATAEAMEMTTLPSGVRYKELRVGEEPVPDSGDLVVLHVLGTTRSGGVFADTRREGKPLAFTLGILPVGVCEGLTDGLRDMQPGGKRLIQVPPELGYGNALGPISFEVEMLRTEALASGAVACCSGEDFPCSTAPEKQVFTLFEDGSAELPYSASFAELDGLMTSSAGL